MEVLTSQTYHGYGAASHTPLTRNFTQFPPKMIGCALAVLVAELINHEAPRVVDLHNYSPANSIPQKLSVPGLCNSPNIPCIVTDLIS